MAAAFQNVAVEKEREPEAKSIDELIELSKKIKRVLRISEISLDAAEIGRILLILYNESSAKDRLRAERLLRVFVRDKGIPWEDIEKGIVPSPTTEVNRLPVRAEIFQELQQKSLTELVTEATPAPGTKMNRPRLAKAVMLTMGFEGLVEVAKSTTLEEVDRIRKEMRTTVNEARSANYSELQKVEDQLASVDNGAQTLTLMHAAQNSSELASYFGPGDVEQRMNFDPIFYTKVMAFQAKHGRLPDQTEMSHLIEQAVEELLS